MNLKLCKRLRRMAEFTSKFQTATQYETKYHMKEVMVLNRDGIKEPHMVQKIQIILGNCHRKTYNQLKREYH